MGNIEIYLNEIINFLVSIGPVGGVLLVILESIIPILPLGVIVGLNVLSFGKVFGFLLSYIATITGCMMSFFLFRYLVKDKYLKIFKPKTKQNIEKWMDKMSNIDFNTLCVMIALPITPSFAVNIAGGLSDIKMKKFLVALFIGKPAMLLFYGYIALSIMDSLKNPIIILKVIGLCLAVYIISKIIEKIIKVD